MKKDSIYQQRGEIENRREFSDFHSQQANNSTTAWRRRFSLSSLFLRFISLLYITSNCLLSVNSSQHLSENFIFHSLTLAWHMGIESIDWRYLSAERWQLDICSKTTLLNECLSIEKKLLSLLQFSSSRLIHFVTMFHISALNQVFEFFFFAYFKSLIQCWSSRSTSSVVTQTNEITSSFQNFSPTSKIKTKLSDKQNVAAKNEFVSLDYSQEYSHTQRNWMLRVGCKNSRKFWILFDFCSVWTWFSFPSGNFKLSQFSRVLRLLFQFSLLFQTPKV